MNKYLIIIIILGMEIIGINCAEEHMPVDAKTNKDNVLKKKPVFDYGIEYLSIFESLSGKSVIEKPGAGLTCDYKYNRTGQVISGTYTESKGWKRKPQSKFVISYNPEGKFSEYITSEYKGNKFTKIKKEVYKYKDGKLVDIKSYAKDKDDWELGTIIKYTYKDKYLIKRAIEDSAGKIFQKAEYSYYQDGNLHKIVVYYLKDNKLEAKICEEYAYNKDGILIREARKKYEGKEWVNKSKKEYSFNNKGFVTENNGFSFVNGDWQKTIKEEYQYDNNNRLAYVRSFSNIKGEFKKIVGKGIRYTDKGNSDFFEQDRFLNIEFNWQIWQIMRYGQVKSTTPS